MAEVTSTNGLKLTQEISKSMQQAVIETDNTSELLREINAEFTAFSSAQTHWRNDPNAHR